MLGVDWDVSLRMIQQKNAGGAGGLDGSERWGRLKEQLLEKLTIMKIKVFLNYLCHFCRHHDSGFTSVPPAAARGQCRAA